MEAVDPKFEELTDDDLDVLSAHEIIFAHAMKRVVGIIEMAYQRRYQKSKQYNELRKTLGKSAADKIAKNGVHRMYSGDQLYQIGRIIKVAEDLKRMVDNLNEHAIKCHTKDTTEMDAFDAISHDTNLLVYMYGLMGNCNHDDDELKILSTLKLLAKGDRVSPRVLDRLKENVEALGA